MTLTHKPKRYILYCFVLIMVLTSFTDANAREVEYTWIANTEPDIAGYRLYYGTTKLDGVTGWDSVIDVGLVTRYTVDLPGGQIGTLYFAGLTAYDTSRNESELSEVVQIFIDEEVPPGQPDGFKNILVKFDDGQFDRLIEAIENMADEETR